MNRSIFKTIFKVVMVVVLAVIVGGCSGQGQKIVNGAEVEVPFPKADGSGKYTYEGNVAVNNEKEAIDAWLQNYSSKFYQNNPAIDLYEGEGSFDVTAEMKLPIQDQMVTLNVQYDYLLKYVDNVWQYSFSNIIVNQSKNGVIANSLEQFVAQYESQQALNELTSDYLTALYGKIDNAFKERISKLQ